MRIGRILCVALAVTAVTAPRAQTPFKAKEERLPTVDYNAPSSRDVVEKARRDVRGKRFDGSLRVAEPHPQAGAGGILDSWMQTLPAMPVTASDAIVTGDVTDAHAYLSPDKTGVYVEYRVRVDEVLKQNSAAPILTGGVVDAQREGGRVRFPSGRVQSYITHYQGVPLKGRRYSLFLKRYQQTDVFILLTGYEHREGRVYPLDGVNLGGGAELSQFSDYNGVDDATFSKDLKRALTKPD